MNKSRTIIIGIILAIFCLSYLTFYIYKSRTSDESKKVYEVAVVIRDKDGQSKDSSLYKGDVLLLKEGEGNPWSRTEEVSYLILKMELSEKQASELISSLVRPMTKDEIEGELKKLEVDVREINRQEIESYKEELKNQTKTVLYRQYKINLEEFAGFEPNQLLKGQPYKDLIYDWSIVEKKEVK